ncbi:MULTISPECIES: GPW/gp25 family protein [Pseudomonas]|uniref:GPW/gp25 family protein n=1 Tax=Pseudomonas TaxID=286 RepID=UPI0005AB4A83|nr:MULTISPECIES: GPW/gp25 family protein [Pseudomonas]AZD92060.1 putative bacteriophage baseplate protein [Pseudomonas chlororaphis subsp. aureofaciens]KAB0531317.1 baseplate protein [Pseudomonas chlororaphis subsp. aureofaciens]TSD32359.1 baseplate protein [Pseudomonas sp. ATCC 13985]WDG62933.1 GPW/gp25 family protein [Pseudomonas chlororaphis]WDG69200.1 GPW/gp25 family protein [Pseudomonas chlororaphis]
MTTPTPYTSITTAHWQPALGTSGEVVEGLRDIDQSIRIILTTPKGADAHRPDFGSDLHLYVDWPVNRVTPHLVREAVDALRRWEARISVVQVQVLIEESQIRVRVQWRVADGVTQLTEVPYARAA